MKTNQVIKLTQKDELFTEAAKIVCADHENARVSRLQIHLKLGYQRANKIMGQLQQAKIVGTYDSKRSHHTVQVKVNDLPTVLNNIIVTNL